MMPSLALGKPVRPRCASIKERGTNPLSIIDSAELGDQTSRAAGPLPSISTSPQEEIADGDTCLELWTRYPSSSISEACPCTGNHTDSAFSKMAIHNFSLGPKALIFSLVSASALCNSQIISPRTPTTDTTTTTVTTFPYQDATLCISSRVEDLLSRMTIAEKAGQLFQPSIRLGPNGTLDESGNGTTATIQKKYLSHFNLGSDITNVTEVVNWHNAIQGLAKKTRLGIPITLSSDPRHAFTENIGTGFEAGRFSQWPESLGLAALRSVEVVQRFAEIAREE